PPGIAAIGAASSAAAVQPLPSATVAPTVVAGVAVDQPAGTDNPPTAPASPMLAEAAAPKPPGANELTMAPSATAASPATGATESARAAGVNPATAPIVFPIASPFGMAAKVNQAPVLTAPLMALKTDGVPRKLSIEPRMP